MLGGASGCGDDGAGGASSASSTVGVSVTASGTNVASTTATSTAASATASSPSSSGTITPCPMGLGDELNDPCTLSQWELGPGTQVDTWDIDTTTPGHLTVTPGRGLWNDNAKAWLVFKEVVGDFVVVTHVTVEGLEGAGTEPSAPFNSAGLMARRPPLPGNDAESWVMFDLGRQQSFFGTEAKTTIEGDSSLYLSSGAGAGRLSLCRVGEKIFLSRNLDADGDAWTRTQTFVRSDLPVTLQVGMVANAYDQADLKATFDYVRFGVPQTEADCTAELPPGG